MIVDILVIIKTKEQLLKEGYRVGVFGDLTKEGNEVVIPKQMQPLLGKIYLLTENSDCTDRYHSKEYWTLTPDMFIKVDSKLAKVLYE